MGSLKAKNLGMTFPGVMALDDVSLEVQSGTIHALVGANGAGKSTLIKILTGYYPEYTGQIEIDNRPVTIRKPADAMTHKIEVVHQEVDTTLIPYLSVTENLLIEQLAEPGSATVLNWTTLHNQARRAIERVGLKVDVRKQVEDLSLHEKQMLVIARAVSRDVQWLILDEPTASFGLREVDILFDVLRELRRLGVGIIYISHRLSEVRSIAGEITVLRSGKEVGHFPGNVNLAQVIEAMLGIQAIEAFPPRPPRKPGEVALEARHLSSRQTVQDVSLTVRQGEVLGIAGLVGAGKTELLRLLFGADRLDAGEIRVGGRVVHLSSPQDAVNCGIFLVPEERRKQGLLVENCVRENITLPFIQMYSTMIGWVKRSLEVNQTNQAMHRVGLVPPRAEMLVKNLSGGNQQKVVIGKWFGKTPHVMLFDEASQGIDIGAKREIYALAHEISNQAGVIYASSDIDEVLAISDRVLVMRDGRVVAEMDSTQANRQQVLEYATGASNIMDTPSAALASLG